MMIRIAYHRRTLFFFPTPHSLFFAMTRYFLYLSYDGTDFLGWQRQPEGRTVQGVLEERLSTILRQPTTILGAGRTDTGVHARLMVCHLDLDMERDAAEELVFRLRRFLPPDISVSGIKPVSPDAHARYDATSRRYGYYVLTQTSPFLRRYRTLVPETLNFGAMNDAARCLIGRHDFTTFSKKHSQVKTHLCTVTEASWHLGRDPEEWVFHITADRFLRNMVRSIVGTLFDVGRGRITPQDFEGKLAAMDRSLSGTSAPSEGLFLEEITYPGAIFIH